MKLLQLPELVKKLNPEVTIELSINTKPLCLFWSPDYLFTNNNMLCELHNELSFGWVPSGKITREEALKLPQTNLYNTFYQSFYTLNPETINKFKNIEVYNYSLFDPSMLPKDSALLLNVYEDNKLTLQLSV